PPRNPRKCATRRSQGTRYPARSRRTDINPVWPSPRLCIARTSYLDPLQKSSYYEWRQIGVNDCGNHHQVVAVYVLYLDHTLPVITNVGPFQIANRQA